MVRFLNLYTYLGSEVIILMVVAILYNKRLVLDRVARLARFPRLLYRGHYFSFRNS